MTEDVVSQYEDQISYGQGHELIKALQKAGMTTDTAQIIIEKSNMAKKIIYLVKSGGFEESSSQRKAREIIGLNFIGIGEIQAYLGYDFNHDDLARLSEIPFPMWVLKRCRSSHILFPAVSMTLKELIKKYVFQCDICFDPKWLEEKCANIKEGGKWCLITKTPLTVDRKSVFSKTPLNPAEIPTAFEVTLLLIVWSLVKVEPLWRGLPILTWNFTDSGERVYVSTDDQSGCIYPFSQEWHKTGVGSIAASVMPGS